MRDILTHLEENDVALPNGGRLSPRRWQQLGIDFGFSGWPSIICILAAQLTQYQVASTEYTASFYSIKKSLTHDFCDLELVFRAANDLYLFKKLSYKLLQTVQEKGTYDGNPIYAVLHEPIYCQG